MDFSETRSNDEMDFVVRKRCGHQRDEMGQCEHTQTVHLNMIVQTFSDKTKLEETGNGRWAVCSRYIEVSEVYEGF